jgi:PAS domain S-box-containing protein
MMSGKTNKQAAQALAELRSRAAPIIERAPLPIVEVQGSSHLVSYVNSAFCNLLGKSRGELIGKCFTAIVCGGHKCVPFLEQVYETGQAVSHAQEDDSDPNGAYWLYAMWPALDENECPAGVIIQLAKAVERHPTTSEMNQALIISAVRQHELTAAAEKLNEQLQSEIAERKRAQEASFLLASIVESSNEAITSIDFNQIITSWNKGAERLYGYSAEEVLGKSIAILTLPEDIKAAVAHVDRIRRGENVDSFEIERRQENGRRLWVSVTISPIHDDTGQRIGLSTVSQDITHRKRLQEELRAARDELRTRAERLEEVVAERTVKLTQSVKYLEDLNYTMAHDLRAPIRAMKAFATALLEDVPLDETGKSYAERIERAAERMNDLVNDLLKFGELTHLEFPIHPVDLKTEIEKVLAQLAREIQIARAELVVREPFPAILGNETLVHQIVSNLLLNALKFIAPGASPKVLVRAETRDSTVHLWVEDAGIGIDAIYHKKIFGVFQRLHTTEEFPGTGVGLAIVERAAERLGCTVGVESEPGKGSRFWVAFPKAPNPLVPGGMPSSPLD